MKRPILPIITLLPALALAGCANGPYNTGYGQPMYGTPSHTTTDAAGGAVLGAVAGAVIGNQSGSPLAGAAIGAGLGGLAGYAVAKNQNGQQVSPASCPPGYQCTPAAPPPCPPGYSCTPQ